jgi:hypothetical protein
MSPEMLAEIKEREEKAKQKPVVVNMAEERLKLKEENERRILKDEYRRKQLIMKEIQ